MSDMEPEHAEQIFNSLPVSFQLGRPLSGTEVSDLYLQGHLSFGQEPQDLLDGPVGLIVLE